MSCVTLLEDKIRTGKSLREISCLDGHPSRDVAGALVYSWCFRLGCIGNVEHGRYDFKFPPDQRKCSTSSVLINCRDNRNPVTNVTGHTCQKRFILRQKI